MVMYFLPVADFHVATASYSVAPSLDSLLSLSFYGHTVCRCPEERIPSLYPFAWRMPLHSSSPKGYVARAAECAFSPLLYTKVRTLLASLIGPRSSGPLRQPHIHSLIHAGWVVPCPCTLLSPVHVPWRPLSLPMVVLCLPYGHGRPVSLLF